ncbi:uncharacterized protein EDB93DRAFT_147343 [Suillus bovinus]|uniref:uncharacterized protein n=1 Tax=Suillus bovinus TaxID=48563 RepID=UPI001B876699|nr:uncharacterized protein EDB93DRAFT_147343 [Suillus bovinus]KAG2128956.1 hypothetical protein EDB93DRAFT_147343 [Suillus bovinus]
MSSLKRASDINPGLIIGPVLVCGLLSAALFGCLACQSCLYFTRFRSDHVVLKAIVSTVILVQLGHFACVISMLWTMTVSTYGDPSQLTVLPTASDISVPLSSLTVSIVQSFYAFRLWRLTRNVFLLTLSQILSVTAQTSAFVFLGMQFSMDLTHIESTQFLLADLALIARAACELIITAGIAWSLYKKRGSEIRSTVSMIDRLLKWTIETGLVTSLMAFTLATLIPTLKQPNNTGLGLYLLWPNVVGNSFLISLNRRSLLRKQGPKKRHSEPFLCFEHGCV